MRSLPLRSVLLPSLADELDRVDPRTRGMVNGNHEPLPPDDEEDRSVITNEAIRSGERTKTFRYGKTQAIRIPAELRDLLPAGIDYIAEVNEDGLLFRPAHLFNNSRPRPSWTTNGTSSNGHAAKR